MAIKCARCGVNRGLAAVLTVDLVSGIYYCPKCREELDAPRRQEQERQREEANAIRLAEEQERNVKLARLLQLSRGIIVTTTPNIEGYRVKKYLGIESIEYVIGTGIFSEIDSSISDFFGMRSSMFESKLSKAKQHAIDAFKMMAAEKGANAILAVDLDYTEFSNNRIALIMNGTLVVIEPMIVTERGQHGSENILQCDNAYSPSQNANVSPDQDTISQDHFVHMAASDTPEAIASRMFEEARQLVNDELFDDAILSLRQIIQHYPDTKAAAKALRSLRQNGVSPESK